MRHLRQPGQRTRQGAVSKRIDVVVVGVVLIAGVEKRFEASVQSATKWADGLFIVAVVDGAERLFSQILGCPNCGRSVPQLEALGGGYQARTALDLWLLEIGYQGQVGGRLVLGVAVGCMGTFGSSTRIVAVDGAPTDNAILTSAANQADTALQKYGYVPTLTLRLGFDLI